MLQPLLFRSVYSSLSQRHRHSHSSPHHREDAFLAFSLFSVGKTPELSPITPTGAEEDGRSNMPTQSFTLDQCAWLCETFGTGTSHPALSQPVMSAAGALPPTGESTSSDPQPAQSTSAGELMVGLCTHTYTCYARPLCPCDMSRDSLNEETKNGMFSFSYTSLQFIR